MGFNIGFSRLSNENQDKRTKSGYLYHWKYTAPGKNSNVAKAEISIATNYRSELRFQHETWGTRLAKWLGFTRELQTGDAEFDKSIFVDSDEPAIGNALGMDSRLRSIILKLFSFGIHEVKVNKGRLTASMQKKFPLLSFSGGSRDAQDFVNEVVAPMMWRNMPSMLEADSLDELVSTLMELEGKLPMSTMGMNMPTEDATKSSYRYRARILNISIVLLFCVGLPLFIYDRVAMPALVHYAPFALAVLKYSAYGTIAFLIVLYALLRGSVRGYEVLKTFLVFGLLGVGFSTADIVYHANIQFDTNPRELHEQRVLDKRITTSHSRKSGTKHHYHIIVQGGTEGERTYDITTTYDQYNRFNVGGTMHITTRKGYLGFEWIESID